MTLTQLRYFQKACKLDNITRAAECLHVSQPSVSAAIRELENEFGITLLDRHGRSFSLTPEGMAFLEQTDRLLAHADNFHRAMEQLGRGVRRIPLGVPPMIGSLVLPALYAGASGRSFELTITEAGRQELLRLLSAGELDMAFLPHDGPLDPRYDCLPIVELETVCCVSPSHPLAKRQRLSVSELAEEPLILFKNSFFQTERIIARFQAARLQPRVLLQTDQLSTIRKLVSCQVGVGFLFSAIANPLDDLASIPLEPPMTAQVSLVWRAADCLNPDQRRFIACVRSLFPTT